MALHFSKQEFISRKKNTLKSMKEQNLDALLIFRQESMYWLTGYDTFGYVFFQTLVVDQKGDVVLLTRAPDFIQAKNTSNIAKDCTIWIIKIFGLFIILSNNIITHPIKEIKLYNLINIL